MDIEPPRTQLVAHEEGAEGGKRVLSGSVNCGVGICDFPTWHYAAYPVVLGDWAYIVKDIQLMPSHNKQGNGLHIYLTLLLLYASLRAQMSKVSETRCTANLPKLFMITSQHTAVETGLFASGRHNGHYKPQFSLRRLHQCLFTA